MKYNAVDGNATLIEARDADKADTVNSKVFYKTDGVNKDLLSIDPATGMLLHTYTHTHIHAIYAESLRCILFDDAS